ncbi:1-acyl-sn-glycerol-3-phosphate acyltransferase [Agriterribacter sp.]|uniref:1-acyl-sn-glycerol-3-phosphate acyltransferase n=1 Tax=Agriterribacter sp. TaxID=2821509 RepID=UPI002C2A8DBB|nr:1-acyl-sn-glycerol-3-phosphate acyltransferase [Agriterribacter sp.]HTN09103.1 1-acyl-sn-glycerol-3-phosphate acyltransferase [Agriterribacter sp.]
MFYYCIKLLARCSLLFFFRKKITCGFPLHALKGPAIIASNHPNSLLDAVVIACQCRQPVHFTIRSDMFNNPMFRLLLKFLNGIPVYRASEEKEKLRANFSSIALCSNILKNRGIIIVFSEGITLHDWKLKPIKSGTAKIVQHALRDPQLIQTLQVVPVGLTYSDYAHPAKTIIIQTGEVFYPGKLLYTEHSGVWKQAFNTLLFERLQPLIPAMERDEAGVKLIWQSVIANITFRDNCNAGMEHLQYQGRLLSAIDIKPAIAQKIKYPFFHLHCTNYYKIYFAAALFGMPALAGLLLNSLFYFPVNCFTRIKTKSTIFYDSLFFGLLTILYPVYILIASISLAYLTDIPLTLWVLTIPFCGWCTVQFWVYALKIKNHLTLSPPEKKYMQAFITGMEYSVISNAKFKP